MVYQYIYIYIFLHQYTPMFVLRCLICRNSSLPFQGVAHAWRGKMFSLVNFVKDCERIKHIGQWCDNIRTFGTFHPN